MGERAHTKGRETADDVGIREIPARTPPIRQETAVVFRGGGRRFFTRKAAERAEAKAIIRKRCECERGDILNGDYGYTCRYHSDRDRYERAVRLLLAMFIHERPASPSASSGRNLADAHNNPTPEIAP